MTPLESAVWKLFKEYFGDNYVKNGCPASLLGIRDYLKALLKKIESRLEQFE